MAKRQIDIRRIEVVDDAIAEILRGKTPAERLAAGFAANRTARMIIAGGIRFHHPDWDEAAVRREVARRMSDGAI